MDRFHNRLHWTALVCAAAVAIFYTSLYVNTASTAFNTTVNWPSPLHIAQAGRIATTTPSSVVLNQASPHFGDSVNYTAVYPKVATQKVGRQQMFNPDIQTDCYQVGTHVYSQVTVFTSSTQNGDGSITGASGFITLGGAKNELNWASGGASCVATLYYFSAASDGSKSLVYNFLASANFLVSD